MDSLIAAAGRALAIGDTLGALNCVALRNDPPALALRGIAMAQLGEYSHARDLLRRAAASFGIHEEAARARCVVAEAEVALAMRDLRDSPQKLAAAWTTLEKHADRANAQHARLIAVRRLILLGRLEESATTLAHVDINGVPPALLATAELATAELALRSLHTATATAALARARAAAEAAGIAALVAEVDAAGTALICPVARSFSAGREQPLRLHEVEALLNSDALVIDACRRGLGVGANKYQSLARRPLLFALARALAEAWPGEVDRQTLIARVFRTRHADESHRVRLRVEISRLRALLAPLATIEASPQGYALAPQDGRELVVLLPPIEGDQAALLALLADGEAWSSSALAGATTLRIRDKLVTPGDVNASLDCFHGAIPARPKEKDMTANQHKPGKITSPEPVRTAQILREFGPFNGADHIHGVSYDGQNVWAAVGSKLIAIDPGNGHIERALACAGDAGTAFDGTYLYQIAAARIHKIDPTSGVVLSSIPAPGAGRDSGLAWAEGSLWVGQHRDRLIHQINPETGAIVRTIESNRFVTGVTWVDGQLWHGTWEGDKSDIRRINSQSGEVLERLEMPPGIGVSGLESDGADQFFCGGGPSGKLRVVRKPTT